MTTVLVLTQTTHWIEEKLARLGLTYFDYHTILLSLLFPTMIVNRRVWLIALTAVATVGTQTSVNAFSVTTTKKGSTSSITRRQQPITCATHTTTMLHMTEQKEQQSANSSDKDSAVVDDFTFESEEQKKQVVGNLVADDEWDGLTLELTDLVRKSCT